MWEYGLLALCRTSSYKYGFSPKGLPKSPSGSNVGPLGGGYPLPCPLSKKSCLPEEGSHLPPANISQQCKKSVQKVEGVNLCFWIAIGSPPRKAGGACLARKSEGEASKLLLLYAELNLPPRPGVWVLKPLSPWKPSRRGAALPLLKPLPAKP